MGYDFKFSEANLIRTRDTENGKEFEIEPSVKGAVAGATGGAIGGTIGLIFGPAD